MAALASIMTSSAVSENLKAHPNINAPALAGAFFLSLGNFVLQFGDIPRHSLTSAAMSQVASLPGSPYSPSNLAEGCAVRARVGPEFRVRHGEGGLS